MYGCFQKDFEYYIWVNALLNQKLTVADKLELQSNMRYYRRYYKYPKQSFKNKDKDNTNRIL